MGDSALEKSVIVESCEQHSSVVSTAPALDLVKQRDVTRGPLVLGKPVALAFPDDLLKVVPYCCQLRMAFGVVNGLIPESSQDAFQWVFWGGLAEPGRKWDDLREAQEFISETRPLPE
jgi:hypothetical protein